MKRAQIASGVFELQFCRPTHRPGNLCNENRHSPTQLMILTVGYNDVEAQSFVNCGKKGEDHVQKYCG